MPKDTSQNELLAILDDGKNEPKKTKKGPKTVIVEEPLMMSGDPLGLSSFQKENIEAKTPARVKKRDEILVEP